MSKLCQDCYAIARPDDYFPATFREGTCDACDQHAYIARARKDEVETVRDRLSDDEITREGRAMAQGGLI